MQRYIHLRYLTIMAFFTSLVAALVFILTGESVFYGVDIFVFSWIGQFAVIYLISQNIPEIELEPKEYNQIMTAQQSLITKLRSANAKVYSESFKKLPKNTQTLIKVIEPSSKPLKSKKAFLILPLLGLLLTSGCDFQQLCVKHGNISIQGTYSNITVTGDANISAGRYEIDLFGCDGEPANTTEDKPILEEIEEAYYESYKSR